MLIKKRLVEYIFKELKKFNTLEKIIIKDSIISDEKYANNIEVIKNKERLNINFSYIPSLYDNID